jgi:hypothetical protein
LHTLNFTRLVLALTSALAVAAHAATPVPVTQTCFDARVASTYVASATGSKDTQVASTLTARLTPCLIETDLGTSEPALLIGKDGALVYSPVHLPDGGIGVMRSKDNGGSWDVTVPLRADGTSHSRVQPSTYLEPETGRLLFSSSRASFSPIKIQLGLDMSISDDGGDTWRASTVTNYKGLDWVKYAAGQPKTSTLNGFPKVLYLSGPTPISTSAVVVAPKTQQVLKSLDGGDTWVEAGGFDITLGGSNCPFSDYILFGSSTTLPDGTLVIGGRHCTKVGVAISKDEGKTWTVKDIPNTKLIAGTTTIGIPANPNFVLGQPITSDADGNLYALYADDKNLLRLTVSRDQGTTWSTPVVVSAPKIKQVHLTSLAVKTPGQIAIAYYGSEDTGSVVVNHNVYVAESNDVFKAQPVFKSQLVNRTDTPLFPKGFDSNYIGMFLGGDLAELTQIQYAPNGDLFVSFVQDMCPGGLTTTSNCKWDFQAHNKSRYRALVGHLTH